MLALRSERCHIMNENEIRNYARLMKEFGLTRLEITEDNKSLRLERAVLAGVQESSLHPDPVLTLTVPKPKEHEDYISIKSPIVGVFYASPAEDGEPYVAVGDHVKKGQTLCIIEAMKLMNEITAEEEGVILEICVSNGQIVECGTELFRIKR